MRNVPLRRKRSLYSGMALVCSRPEPDATAGASKAFPTFLPTMIRTARRIAPPDLRASASDLLVRDAVLYSPHSAGVRGASDSQSRCVYTGAMRQFIEDVVSLRVGSRAGVS